MKKLITLLYLTFSQIFPNEIDGVAAIIENHIVLKSDLAQMVNMAVVQNRIDPIKNGEAYIKIQNSVLQSMIDQKIMLEMAEKDSVLVGEKEVNQALEQQIQMFISQTGSEKKAEKALGQSLKDFRREFWYDMQERLISEKYQQQLIGSISITREDVLGFYKTYKDSLPSIPMRAKVRHLLVPIKPSDNEKEKTVFQLNDIKDKIIKGEPFSEIAIKHSEDPGSKENGGSLGWVSRGSLVKEFETAAFTAKIGEIVGPIETEFGFHILEVLERKGEKTKVRHILKTPLVGEADNEKAYLFAMSLQKDSIKTLDDFKKAVSSYTADKTTKKIGGDLGWIEPQNYQVSEIGQAIKYININSCSPPINSSLGFHLLWLEGVKKGGRPNITDHWSEIESLALNKKKMDWYTNWIKEAREKFYIEIKS
tara:strand:- start:5295 stop:6563 length:1269 start_codon:yes stop_codon:yes gene_type:complete